MPSCIRAAASTAALLRLRETRATDSPGVVKVKTTRSGVRSTTND